MIDSGIWPESPSFAALPEPRPDADVIAAKWYGTCEPGDDPTEDPVTCNNKLIGARCVRLRLGADQPTSDFHSRRATSTATARTPPAPPPATTTSPAVDQRRRGRPGQRHGAGGPRRGLQGLLRATRRLGGNCGAIEAVAAIDDAVADGVDVINYSIGGSTGAITDLLRPAFFNAAAAGVFVSDVGRQQRPGREHGRAQQPVDHDGGGEHPRPRSSASR